ncbi:MAG: hypothetical protein ABI664_14230 [bacterium]
MSRTAFASRTFLLLALAVALGCAADGPTEVLSYETGAPGIQAGYVGVTPTAAGLTIENQTERPIHLFAVNAETLALLDWIPCTGGEKCPALAPGARRDIPWADVFAYSANVKQYTVYWWNVTVQPDGSARADNLHNVTVSR